VRLETWGGLVFINLDPDAAPLLESIQPLVDRYSEFTHAPLRAIRPTKTLEIQANWKVVLEAFLEGYHALTIHKQTIGPAINYRGTASILHENGHSSMYTPLSRAKDIHGNDLDKPATFIADSAPVPNIGGLDDFYQVANAQGFAFPNATMSFDPAGYPVLRFWPISKDRTLYEETWLAVDWGDEPRPEGWDARMKGWDLIFDEDVENLEPIQAAIDAAAHNGIPLCYQERRIYHLHQELDKAIGVDNIPAEMRVPDLLNHMIERTV
jgi:phenylpropionate dioxygenase-like ring-hydroxylating dioxygenase large terminal subunit